MERASHVCSTCKSRKKACDKGLPQCGYCSKRRIECSYEGEACSLSSEQLQESLGLDAILNAKVSQTLQTAGFFSQNELCERYFRGFHAWLPVVSPQLFRESLSEYIIPPADYSVLTLVMCLLTDSGAHLQSLYVEVKILLSQVQAQLGPTVTLVQANLLVVAYEYASGSPTAAYISVATCAAMGYLLNIQRYSHSNSTIFDKSGAAALEAWNVWWGIVILQRLILIELFGDQFIFEKAASNARSPVLKMATGGLSNRIWSRTEFPDEDSPLPVDLTLDKKLSLEIYATNASETSKSSTASSGVTCFGQQAQAVYFFEQLLRSRALSGWAKVIELKKLDTQIQEFIRSFMQQEYHGRRRKRTGVMATTIRTLFALHEEVLRESSLSDMKGMWAECAEASRATLQTIVQIVVDTAQHQMTQEEGDDDTRPCCFYSLRTARKHAQEKYDNQRDNDSLNHLLTIRALQDTLRTPSMRAPVSVTTEGRRDYINNVRPQRYNRSATSQHIHCYAQARNTD